MATFNDVAAGAALSRLSRRRATESEVAMPADVCLFAWLTAEAARQNSNPFTISARQIQFGFSDERGRVDKVGLSVNTIALGLERLKENGFIQVEQVSRLRGGGRLMSITIVGSWHGTVERRKKSA